ncbi:MAG TPA: 2'-5' RNA ligase family protein [Bacteroidia bacterium]|jgi:2'-5' RNA ligase|nr:2'-5' RNA ligase family protein [Bacteroidia bacterium]
MSIQKYFIAIVIPEPFQTELMGLKNVVKDKFNSKGALRSPAHITLHMPFEWKKEKEDALVNTLQQFTFNESFKIKLQNFACFEPRVLFVDVVKNLLLEQLQHELAVYAQKNLRLLNQVNDMRGFHPHVTIAFRDLKKDKFYQALDYFKTQTYKATFEAKSFCLLKHTGKEWLTYKEFIFAAN